VAKVTTSGVITEYRPPTPGSFSQSIAAGPDGNLWFTENGGTKVAKVTTSGVFTEYPTPDDSEPVAIAAVYGSLWVTENLPNQLAEVTTSGVFTEHTIPTSGSGPSFGIAAGPDGNLWLTIDNLVVKFGVVP
jgi:virginiamycin B lyase